MRILLLLLTAIFLLPFSGGKVLAQDDLREDQLVSPSAQDILDQIEGHAPSPLPPQADEGSIVLEFSEGAHALSMAHKSTLITGLPGAGTQSGRIKIIAYARPSSASPDTPRRISLERALLVREFLKENGIQGTRIDIFPMGDQMEAPVRDYVIINTAKG